MFEGRLQKDGKFWMIEVPALDIATQGKTRSEAFEMIADAIESLVNKVGFKVQVGPLSKDCFIVAANDPRLLMALFLKRQREAEKLTVRAVAKRLKYKSPSAYSQYEGGKSMPGLEFVGKFVNAVVSHNAVMCLSIKRSA